MLKKNDKVPLVLRWDGLVKQKTLVSVGKILRVVPSFKANYGIFVQVMYFFQTKFDFSIFKIKHFVNISQSVLFF